MSSFGLHNINRSFFLTLKPVDMSSSILFVVCFLLNALFLLFFAVKLSIGSAAHIFFHFNLEKHHSYFSFSFLTTVYLLYCIFRFLSAKYIHCIFLVCSHGSKKQMLHLRRHLNNWKDQGCLVHYLVVSKYVVSTVFWHFNFEMAQITILLQGSL